MWAGIFAIGAIMAIGSLYVLDADLPGGFVAGGGNLRHAQTMTFTTLMLFQLFNVFNARSDEESALRGLLKNRWLLGAIALSILLQLAVVYVPFLQQAFSTEKLSGFDWLRCTLVASSVLWLREIQKARPALRVAKSARPFRRVGELYLSVSRSRHVARTARPLADRPLRRQQPVKNPHLQVVALPHGVGDGSHDSISGSGGHISVPYTRSA